MKIICTDIVDYGTEKNITDYCLEDNTLLIHTLCREKGKNSIHTNVTVQLTADQAQLLNNMNEKDCLDWVLKHQPELIENHTIKRE